MKRIDGGVKLARTKLMQQDGRFHREFGMRQWDVLEHCDAGLIVLCILCLYMYTCSWIWTMHSYTERSLCGVSLLLTCRYSMSQLTAILFALI